MTVVPRARTREIVAADGLLHPVPLAAIGLLILNDHVLKQLFPGFVTGKLSDFAGLAFFPLFLQALWEVGAWLRGRQRLADQRVLVAAIVATGILFASIKVVPAANELWSGVLGTLQWLAGLPATIASGGPTLTPIPVQIALDPTDLIALPALLVAYIVGVHRAAHVHPEGDLPSDSSASSSSSSISESSSSNSSSSSNGSGGGPGGSTGSG